MYGIFNYIWVIYGINVSKYAIHGSSGMENTMKMDDLGDFGGTPISGNIHTLGGQICIIRGGENN